MELVDLKKYSEELALLIDMDIKSHDGYHMTSFDNSHDLINDCISLIDNGQGYFWAILEEEKLAGFFGFYAHKDSNSDNQYFFLTRTYLLKTYRSTGINAHIKSTVNTVFSDYRIPLYAKVHKDNVRSVKSVLKIFGVFQFYDGDYSVFMLSHGETIKEKSLKVTISRLSSKIQSLVKQNSTTVSAV